MDFISNYQGGGPSKREKSIVKDLKEKYPILIEKKLITQSGRITKNKEDEVREYITNKVDLELLDEYIIISIKDD